MSMSPHIADREIDKFVETSEGETAVRVKPVENDSDQEITVKQEPEFTDRQFMMLESINRHLLEIKEILKSIGSE